MTSDGENSIPPCENCFSFPYKLLLCEFTGDRGERQRLFSKLILFNYID
jgi:hypothetical protein